MSVITYQKVEINKKIKSVYSLYAKRNRALDITILNIRIPVLINLLITKAVLAIIAAEALFITS